MRCVQRLVDLLGDARGRDWLERAALADDRGEIAAVDQLHDDERVARFHAVVEDVDHVGVAERRGRLCLLAEARHERRVAAVLGAQHLDRDVAAQLRVVGAEDRGHAALAEQLDEPVATGEHLSYLGQARRTLRDCALARVASHAHVLATQLRSSPDRKRRNSPPMSGRSSASSTEALSQPIVVPAS